MADLQPQLQLNAQWLSPQQTGLSLQQAAQLLQQALESPQQAARPPHQAVGPPHQAVQSSQQADQHRPAKRVCRRKPKPENPEWAGFQTMDPDARKALDTAAKEIGGHCAAVSCSSRPDPDGRTLQTPHLVRLKRSDKSKDKGFLMSHEPTNTQIDASGQMTTRAYKTYTADEVVQLMEIDGGVSDKGKEEWSPLSRQALLATVDFSAPPLHNGPEVTPVNSGNGSLGNHASFDNTVPSLNGNPFNGHVVNFNPGFASGTHLIENPAMNYPSNHPNTNGAVNSYFMIPPIPAGLNSNRHHNQSLAFNGANMNGPGIAHHQPRHGWVVNSQTINGSVPNGHTNYLVTNGTNMGAPAMNNFALNSSTDNQFHGKTNVNGLATTNNQFHDNIYMHAWDMLPNQVHGNTNMSGLAPNNSGSNSGTNTSVSNDIFSDTIMEWTCLMERPSLNDHPAPHGLIQNDSVCSSTNTNGQAGDSLNGNSHMHSNPAAHDVDTEAGIADNIHANGNISSSPVPHNIVIKDDIHSPDSLKVSTEESEAVGNHNSVIPERSSFDEWYEIWLNLGNNNKTNTEPTEVSDAALILPMRTADGQEVVADGSGVNDNGQMRLTLNALNRLPSEKEASSKKIDGKHRQRSHECLDSSSKSGNLSSTAPARASLRQQQANKLSSNVTLTNVPLPCNVLSQTSEVSTCMNIPHAPPVASGIKLLNPEEKLPDRFHTVFPYDVFNSVQSKCFETIYLTDDNMVVSAPTGSGKTVLFELAICRLSNQDGNENTKIVYIAPTKALCKEKVEQWRKKFVMMTMPVSELTGDTTRTEMRTVREAKIIVTTPEKWDSITRSWVDHRKLLDMVGLFLIDEVHILKECRGATLEAVVSRMKTYGSKVRFIALSATVPNSGDIASWLGKSCEYPSIPARQEVFREDFRPVKLQKFVHGFDKKLTDHAFDNYLNGQLWKHIEMHTQRKPLLVFCMTRKSCLSAAKELAKQWSQRQPGARLWPQPKKRIRVTDPSLQELVRHGVAFHHAGLDPDDRKAVHQAFEDGHLSVICCTSTLAIGVNLPCHTVVLKGTVSYQDGGQLCEYSDLEVMQMLGRAGRPKYEDSALAIILTRSCNRTRYEDLDSGQQILESTLHMNLIEHVNSEISLGTFYDIIGARLWLQGTFLSVRLQQNPQHYGNLSDEKSNLCEQKSDGFEDRLERICETAINKLRDVYLIKGGTHFQRTDYGRAMSKYMIRFETMKMILKIPRGAKVPDLLNALCEAHEFNEIRWQPNEKELFRNINRDPFVMYPIGCTVSTVAHKISLLIQMELGRVEMTTINGIERQRLRAETSRVLNLMHRLIRTVIECKGSDSDGTSCWAALELARSLTAKVWEDKPMQLLQVPQLGPALMRKLVSHNIRTLSQLANLKPSEIERIASRNPPFGRKILDSVDLFPKLSLVTTVKDSKVGPGGNPVIHIDGKLGFQSSRCKWQGKIPIVTFLAVTTEGVTSHFCRESLSAFDQRHNNHHIHFTWTPQKFQDTLVCQFACEEIVGTAVSTELHHNLPASMFSPRIGRNQLLPINVRKAVQPHVSSVCHPIEDDLDDEDLLGTPDSVMCSTDFNKRTHAEVDTEHDDIRAMLDSNGNDNGNGNGKSLYEPKVAEKRGRESDPAQSYQQVAEPRSSSDAFQEKPGFNTKKQLPQPRELRGQKAMSQLSDRATVENEPVRLANGNYMCGHRCSQVGGGTTVRGVKCGHDCCRNGSKDAPKKYIGSGKRKAQVGGEVKSSSYSITEFSVSKRPLKRAKKNDASKSNATPSVPPAALPTDRQRLPQRIILDLGDMDEEGIIDLTRDYESESDTARQVGASATSISKRNGEPASGAMRPKSSDNLLGDLSDNDFIGIEIALEPTPTISHRHTSSKHSNSSDYSDLSSSSMLLKETQDMGMHSIRGEPLQMASRKPGRDKERLPDATRRSKTCTTNPRVGNESSFELSSPHPCVTVERVASDGGGCDDQSSFTPTKPRAARPSTQLMFGTAPSMSANIALLQNGHPVTNKCMAMRPNEGCEPQWVNDFDPALVSEFRGLVDFM